MRTEEQTKMIHLALRWLGKASQSKSIAALRSHQISGAYFVALELGSYTSALSEIEHAATRFYLFSDHRLPEFCDD